MGKADFATTTGIWIGLWEQRKEARNLYERTGKAGEGFQGGRLLSRIFKEKQKKPVKSGVRVRSGSQELKDSCRSGITSEVRGMKLESLQEPHDEGLGEGLACS